MNEWLLVIVMFLPNGDFNIEKTVPKASEADCESAAKIFNEVTRKNLSPDPDHYKHYFGVCVTRAEFEGRKTKKTIAYVVSDTITPTPNFIIGDSITSCVNKME